MAPLIVIARTNFIYLTIQNTMLLAEKVRTCYFQDHQGIKALECIDLGSGQLTPYWKLYLGWAYQHRYHRGNEGVCAKEVGLRFITCHSAAAYAISRSFYTT